MPNSKYRFLSGQDLIEILSVTGHPPVKVLDKDPASRVVLGVVEPVVALAFVRSGNVVGKCSRSRVVHLREMDSRSHASDPTYWDGRACGLYRWPSTPVTNRSVAIWERCLRSSSLEPVTAA